MNDANRAKKASSQPGSGALRVGRKPKSHRTTVALSAEAAELVARYQEASGLSLSDAVSALIERSEQAPARIKFVDGLPMADVPMDGDWISTRDVLRAENEPW
jgi:homospermidine synthase